MIGRCTSHKKTRAASPLARRASNIFLVLRAPDRAKGQRPLDTVFSWYEYDVPRSFVSGSVDDLDMNTKTNPVPESAPVPPVGIHEHLFSFISPSLRIYVTAAGLSALTYTFGFLILLDFHHAYGLRAAESDLFRVKYFHVGIIFVALLLCILFPMLVFQEVLRAKEVFVAKQKDMKAAGYHMSRTSTVAFGIMCINFYGVLIFAAPGHFRDLGVQIPLLVTIFVPAIAWLKLRKNLKTDALSKQQKQSLRRRVICILLAAAVCLIFPRRQDFYTMFWPSGVWFFFSTVMIGLCLGRIHSLTHELTKKIKHEANVTKPEDILPKDLHLRIWILGVSAILIGFFCLTIFANGIYLYIPAEKGGGDFAYSGDTILRCDVQAKNNIPRNLIASTENGQLISKPLVLLEATEKVLYVADASENGGKSEWKRNRGNHPQVFEIPRCTEIQIEYHP